METRLGLVMGAKTRFHYGWPNEFGGKNPGMVAMLGAKIVVASGWLDQFETGPKLVDKIGCSRLMRYFIAYTPKGPAGGRLLMRPAGL